MQKKTLILIFALLIITLLVLIMATNIFIFNIKQPKNETSVIFTDPVELSFSKKTYDDCVNINDTIYQDFCYQIVSLEQAKNGNFVDCADEKTNHGNWGKFMCGFIKSPTNEYCVENINLLGAESSECSWIVDVIATPNSNNVRSEVDASSLFFTKAFYLSDPSYCDRVISQQESDFIGVNITKICTAVASR